MKQIETPAKKAVVTIHHSDKLHTFSVRPGLGFQAICAFNKTPIEFDCRKADCGICIFKVLKGAENLSPPSFAEKDFLKAMRAEPEERLACQTRALGDVTIILEFW